MTRQTRLMLVFAVALVAALSASGGVYLAIQRRPAVRVEVPATHIVVAARPLPMGVLLTKEHVRLVPWPSRSAVANAFTSIDAVLNRGLIAAVAENEPISRDKVAPFEAGAGLPPAIKPGMRAMAVKANEVIGVAGFVVPGSRVDVLMTIPDGDNRLSRVVASYVQVLASGDRYDEAKARSEGKPIPSKVVTLMVTPEDAERITLAASEGQIALVLRNPLDSAPTVTEGVSTRDLKKTTEPPAAPPAPIRVARVAPLPQPPLAAPPRTVETIKAGKRAQELLRDEESFR